MVTILVTVAIALAVACVVLFKSRTYDPDQLVQRRAVPLMMGVQIICGDCSGEGYRPNRTYLDRSGHCARCGGSNYVLASVVAAYRAMARAERAKEAYAESGGPRIIPFRVPVSRASHSKKAV